MYQDDRENKVIKRGLTLKQAQTHCQDPATSGDGWFDGYDEDDQEITIRELESALEDALDMLSYKEDLASFYKKNVNKLKKGVAK